MTIKYTVTVDQFGAAEQLEIDGRKFKRDHTRREFGLISSDDDFCEQMADAGFPEEIAEKVFDTIDSDTLALDLAQIRDSLERED